VRHPPARRTPFSGSPGRLPTGPGDELQVLDVGGLRVGAALDAVGPALAAEV
jgi:hypothetical protein